MRDDPLNASASDPRTSLAPDALADAQRNGFPIVASQLARKDRAGTLVGLSLALLLGAGTLFAMSSSRTKPVAAIAPPTPTAVIAPALAKPLGYPAAPLAVFPTPAPVTLPSASPVPVQPVNPNIALDRLRAPALIVDNSPSANAATPSAPTPTTAGAKAAPQSLTGEEQFAQRVGTDADTVAATRMVSPSTTVAQGTLMSAVLETAIDTDVPGYVRAIISSDVKGYDGAKILIPRSSRVIGQYKSGLAVGQTRAYIVWTRLIRPDGVSIALASPTTDSSGRNGLSGKVDSHFGKRFGSAILLSAIGAIGQAVGGGGSSVVVTGPQQTFSQSAQGNLTIPPTIRVGVGQPIRIFTARDLDFSGVAP